MPTSKAILTAPEKEALWRHLLKHKAYPYVFNIKKTIDNTNFNNADTNGGGRYRTYTFQPQYATGIIGIACGFIITPNATTGSFTVIGSYRSTVDLGDSGSLNLEGTDVYRNISNGGEINDFQVFFPLNYYVEANKPFYMHFWADTTTCTAGTSTMQGHFTLLTLPTDFGG